ncbi:damage-control phosphatase ARMT1 family protein [Athalassotoga saccharophila]|uniref:damage-control phosphatase ARMT1 family protein n=1 Tax=Athalassotoga saccharophila TaxID=1441386 RepID=UPI00137B4661|nr:ARMT1-like domain-containing protein [Athalassotoga saccharophila]BBJ27962.1 hypothetical protein ATHSA_0857 [Athalassotoga saccharophila]
MKATKECFACVIAQAERNLEEWDGDDFQKFEVMRYASKSLENAKYGMKPIELSKIVNDTVKMKTGINDHYKSRKKTLNLKAIGILKEIEKFALESKDPLKSFAISSILGNHLDFGVNNVKIDEEFTNLLKTKTLSIDDYDLFIERLKSSRLVLYILDNTGEIVFDKRFIEEIKKRFNVRIIAAVRSAPIINDATLEDAIAVGFEKAEIIESGSEMAGMTLETATDEFLDLWKRSDLIISKGQGNFEGLDEIKDERLFFFLESKCPVISKILGVRIGDIVLKQSK